MRIIRPIGYVPPAPIPEEELQRRDVLQTLNNLLEYSVNRPPKPPVHVLGTLRAFTPHYAKALSGTRRQEFYFPLKMHRSRTAGGAFFQILAVLRRDDLNEPCRWDVETGAPLRNMKLVDDMRESERSVYRVGFELKRVSKIFTPGKGVL